MLMWRQLILVLCVLCACGRFACASMSVAVVATDEELRAVSDLLAVQLSKDADLKLLERDRIDAILTEHELALGKSANGAGLFKTGHLLGADALLVLRIVEAHKEKWLSIRLVSVRHAVILEDLVFAFPVQDSEKFSADLDAALRQGLKKAKIPLKESHAVSIVGGFRGIQGQTII